LLSPDKIVLSVLANYFSEVPGKGVVLNLVFCSSRSFELCVIELGVLKNTVGAGCWNDPGRLNIRRGHAQCSQYGFRVTASYRGLRYKPTALKLMFSSFPGLSLAYLLTPWCRVLLENLTGLQLVKKFPAFYGT